MITPTQLINAARNYLGTPYRHQGRDKRGLDCAGLIVVTLQDLGVAVADVQGYTMNPHRGRLQKIIESNTCISMVDVPESGDILLIRFKTEPQHLAFKTDLGIIHATADLGMVVEHRFTEDFGIVVGAYRVSV